MALTIETEKLIGFLQHFYTITGLRISLFDLDFNELISVGEPNEICYRIKESSQGAQRCRECDISAQLYIKATMKTTSITATVGLWMQSLPSQTMI